MLIEKEMFLFICGQLKYISFIKENHKKSNQRNETHEVNMVEPNEHEEEKKPFYKLPISPT